MIGALILIAGMSFTSVRETGTYETPPSEGSSTGVIALVFTLGAMLAPGIAGIFLGATGLSAVRESGGRSGGAGFGTFATLAWPLLILTILIVAPAVAAGSSFIGVQFTPALDGWICAAIVLAGVAIALWLDLRIVRSTLRWSQGDRAGAA